MGGVTGMSAEDGKHTMGPDTTRRSLRLLAATAALGLLPLLAACGDDDGDDDDRDDDGMRARAAVVMTIAD